MVLAHHLITAYKISSCNLCVLFLFASILCSQFLPCVSVHFCIDNYKVTQFPLSHFLIQYTPFSFFLIYQGIHDFDWYVFFLYCISSTLGQCVCVVIFGFNIILSEEALVLLFFFFFLRCLFIFNLQADLSLHFLGSL